MSQRSAVRAWLRGERLDRHLRAQGHTCHIIEKLNTEINVGLADPKLKARFADLGTSVFPGSPSNFGKFIAEETEKWGTVVKF